MRVGVFQRFEPFITMLRVGSASNVQVCSLEILFYVYTLVVIGLYLFVGVPRQVESVWDIYQWTRGKSPTTLKTRFYFGVAIVLLLPLALLSTNLDSSPPHVLADRSALLWIGATFCAWSLTVALTACIGLWLRSMKRAADIAGPHWNSEGSIRRP
jgi:hypothetical protein